MTEDRFEKVSRFADIDLPMPQRATSTSAGYDFVVAEDITLPPYEFFNTKLRDAVEEKTPNDYWGFTKPLSLDEVAKLTKELKCKIPLVSTGMKVKLEPDEYLQLSVRSSTPLKHWLILGNGIGIIDSDYYNNPDNEGEIFLQLINLLPFAVKLQRGEKIGQGIICKYGVTADDIAEAERLGGFGSTS